MVQEEKPGWSNKIFVAMVMPAPCFARFWLRRRRLEKNPHRARLKISVQCWITVPLIGFPVLTVSLPRNRAAVFIVSCHSPWHPVPIVFRALEVKWSEASEGFMVRAEVFSPGPGVRMFLLVIPANIVFKIMAHYFCLVLQLLILVSVARCTHWFLL